MDKSLLKKVILEQQDRYTHRIKKELVSRSVEKAVTHKKGNHIQIISGIRRSGKSTLMDMIRMSAKESDYYINFDDERLIDFTVKDFQMLVEVFLELYGEQDTFYFDEIQNIKMWERFVRRLHDSGSKVYVTGSNAAMLSRELGTHLTGRYLQQELYPFSFVEFLAFKKVTYNKDLRFITKEQMKIKRLFNEYIKSGGFPEYLITKDPNRLKELYDNIIYRDVITRYGVKEAKSLKELAHFVASNVGKLASFRSLAKAVNLKSSVTVKEYLHFFENSYLAFLLPKYDASIRGQIYADKKIYFIDSALSKVVGFRFSEDYGRILENTVFLELKRRTGVLDELFYYQNNGECDFLLKSGATVAEAIQVTKVLNKETYDREVNGLVEAMEQFKLKEGLILTEDQEDEFKIGKNKIKVMPVYKWLLS